ncbi:hypothetical protein ACFQ0B_00405 [Nonomuraea thailandensis]
MIDRLLVDIADGGLLSLSMWQAGELPQRVGEPAPLVLPLDQGSLEDLRWYLEEYLNHPYAVYAGRGSGIAARLAAWGRACSTRSSARPRRGPPTRWRGPGAARSRW